MKAHWKKGIIENHNILAIRMVKIVFKGLENRFSFIHPITPTLVMGGLTISIFVSIKLFFKSSPFNYCHFFIIPIHKYRS